MFLSGKVDFISPQSNIKTPKAKRSKLKSAHPRANTSNLILSAASMKSDMTFLTLLEDPDSNASGMDDR